MGVCLLHCVRVWGRGGPAGEVRMVRSLLGDRAPLLLPLQHPPLLLGEGALRVLQHHVLGVLRVRRQRLSQSGRLRAATEPPSEALEVPLGTLLHVSH